MHRYKRFPHRRPRARIHHTVPKFRKSKSTNILGDLSVDDLSEEENQMMKLQQAQVEKPSAIFRFFSQGAASRHRDNLCILRLFRAAWKEDRLMALKCLFYFRDIRGAGQGERKVFRVGMAWLQQKDPETYCKNLENIAFYGRWDDLWVSGGLEGGTSEAVIELIQRQLQADQVALNQSNGPNPQQLSLLAKWLPSENTSSKKTRRMAKRIREAMGMTPAVYRKMLSGLRRQLNIVEGKMSSKDWPSITYPNVPSKAGLNYQQAFLRHDAERYRQFARDLASGKFGINASTLLPYEIIRRVDQSCLGEDIMGVMGVFSDAPTAAADEQALRDSLDGMWRALPDFLKDNPHNGLVLTLLTPTMQDTVGKHGPAPHHIAVSLAIYFAQRSTGFFKGRFLECSNRTALRRLKSDHIVDAWNEVQNANSSFMHGAANLQSALMAILSAACLRNVPPEEMLSVLYVITDQHRDPTQHIIPAMRKRYINAGYDLPLICWWNVGVAVHGRMQAPIAHNGDGFMTVSGCSPAIFSMVMGGMVKTPHEFMMDTLNSERYNRVVVTEGDANVAA